jgi:alpha-N-dichloroacetyl-p-aminophenylserinol N-oxygenase
MTIVNAQVVQQLNRAWPRRATVAAMASAQTVDEFDASRYDYPTRLVPFFEHPLFQKLDESLQRLVVTWGWIGYNQRTITAEDCVVNPALNYIATELLGPTDWDFQEAIRQTLVDEHYHTLMHMRAMERTRRERQLTQRLSLPPSVTYRRWCELQAKQVEPWEKALTSVAFATVAEISVNAFLDILADDETIQPANRVVAQMHNRDEYAHSRTLAEISKVLYAGLDPSRQRFFVEVLPQALSAFVAQDYSMWEAILLQLDVPDCEAILADCTAQARGAVITRDYTGLHRFAQEIGVRDQMDFDFSETVSADLINAAH